MLLIFFGWQAVIDGLLQIYPERLRFLDSGHARAPEFAGSGDAIRLNDSSGRSLRSRCRRVKRTREGHGAPREARPGGGLFTGSRAKVLPGKAVSSKRGTHGGG